MTKLQEKYEKEVIPKMMEQFGLSNKMAVPKIQKVAVNIGFGKLISGKTGAERKKILDGIKNDLILITGQQPVFTQARKSISGFKIRKGVAVGAMVTLREKRMFDFLERLINIVLPRSRDFSGIDPKSFDKKGNLTLAIKEHISFPEILPEKIKRILSFEITVVTSSQKQKEGIALLTLIGFPIRTSP